MQNINPPTIRDWGDPFFFCIARAHLALVSPVDRCTMLIFPILIPLLYTLFNVILKACLYCFTESFSLREKGNSTSCAVKCSPSSAYVTSVKGAHLRSAFQLVWKVKNEMFKKVFKFLQKLFNFTFYARREVSFEWYYSCFSTITHALLLFGQNWLNQKPSWECSSSPHKGSRNKHQLFKKLRPRTHLSWQEYLDLCSSQVFQARPLLDPRCDAWLWLDSIYT